MEDFTLNELKEDFKELFERGKNDYNDSSIKAAARCFYEYEPIIEDGLTEEITCTLIIGKLLAESGNRISIGQHSAIVDAVEKALVKYSELDLNIDEQEEVFKMAQELSQVLPKMDIQYDPNAE